MFVIADFQLESPHPVDYVEITDGDNTNLGRITLGGQSWDHPDVTRTNITSNTETVNILFHTDGSVTRRGWSLEWSKYSKNV